MSEDIIAKAREITQLIDYQNNSIVSRVILKQTEGNVTLFAFSSGQELSEHTAPYDALVIGLEGKGIIGIDGNENILKSGEIILMPANHPHFLKALTNFKMMLIMIKSGKENI